MLLLPTFLKKITLEMLEMKNKEISELNEKVKDLESSLQNIKRFLESSVILNQTNQSINNSANSMMSNNSINSVKSVKTLSTIKNQYNEIAKSIQQNEIKRKNIRQTPNQTFVTENSIDLIQENEENEDFEEEEQYKKYLPQKNRVILQNIDDNDEEFDKTEYETTAMALSPIKVAFQK